MKKIYTDGWGFYSIAVHRDGTATLKCTSVTFFGMRKVWLNKKYKSLRRAKIALARYCGGMPDEVVQ